MCAPEPCYVLTLGPEPHALLFVYVEVLAWIAVVHHLVNEAVQIHTNLQIFTHQTT